MPFHKLSSLTLSICIATTVAAQEYNIGVHINPVITSPIIGDIDKASHLHISPARLNAASGLNFNVKTKKWSIETGANGILKTMAVKYSQDGIVKNAIYSISSHRVIFESFSIEIPLQIGYLLHHHNSNAVYDIYGFIGSSYETNIALGYSSTASSTIVDGNNTGITTFSYKEPTPNRVIGWANLIVGFKVNAVLRKVGLIDYGLSLHYPMQNAGIHNVVTIVQNGNNTTEIAATFYPSIAHTDFKLCYYFLNFDSSVKRKKYRY